jgi:hypothetical protein
VGLDALIRMTIQVVRIGAKTALLALVILCAVWVLCASALGGVLVGIASLVGADPGLAPLFIAGLVGGLFIGLPLLFAGPLAAFGRAAQGTKPTLRETLLLARQRFRRVAVSYLVPLFLLTTPVSLLPHIEPPLWKSTGGIVVMLVGGVVLLVVYARFFFPTHVIAAIEEPRDYLLARKRGDLLVRGNFVPFLVAAVVPLGIAFSAVPSRVARDTLMETLGARTLDTIAGVAIFVAFLTSIALHTALAAAAYGLAIGRTTED